MLLPPAATSMSEALPMAGFEAIPLVGSDPPHSSPRIISLMSNSTFCCAESSADILLKISAPLDMVPNVPLFSCIIMYSTLLPVLAISSAISFEFIPSHPRPTIKTAPTFGLHPKPVSVLTVCL
ncbi:hypothetical protein DSECCO2_440830 [anaerobic digester metagenome]